MSPGPRNTGSIWTWRRKGSGSAPYRRCCRGEAYADKGVDLQVESIADTARVLVDRQRFGQVMSNLLSNALRHTPAGGQVRSASTDRGRPPRSSRSPMTARASHLTSSDTSSNASTGGCRPQPGQRRGRYRSDHFKALIEAHGGTLTATSPDLVAERCLPSASRCPSRQWGGCSVTTPCPA